MGTSRDDIRGWLKRAEPKHTHMLVVCDTFDYDDYPVFTDNVSEAIEKYDRKDMQKIMEIYDLRKDHEAQVSMARVWNV
jgi:hypothetical protein